MHGDIGIRRIVQCVQNTSTFFGRVLRIDGQNVDTVLDVCIHASLVFKLLIQDRSERFAKEYLCIVRRHGRYRTHCVFTIFHLLVKREHTRVACAQYGPTDATIHLVTCLFGRIQCLFGRYMLRQQIDCNLKIVAAVVLYRFRMIVPMDGSTVGIACKGRAHMFGFGQGRHKSLILPLVQCFLINRYLTDVVCQFGVHHDTFSVHWCRCKEHHSLNVDPKGVPFEFVSGLVAGLVTGHRFRFR